MQFIPQRLQLAMFLRGESVTSLALKAELSKQAISKMQNGDLKPSKGAIMAIADSLQLPLGFFSSPNLFLYTETSKYHKV